MFTAQEDKKKKERENIEFCVHAKWPESSLILKMHFNKNRKRKTKKYYERYVSVFVLNIFECKTPGIEKYYMKEFWHSK